MEMNDYKYFSHLTYDSSCKILLKKGIEITFVGITE